MTSKANGRIKRSEKLKHVEEASPNWVVIAGGALLCTLSIKLCCKLKQAFEVKRSAKAHVSSKENGRSTPNRSHESCKLQSQSHRFTHNEDGCCQYVTGISDSTYGAKYTPISPMCMDGDNSLPMVKVPSAHSSIDNGGAMQASLLDHLELPLNPFNHPNSLDSSCISESGSDIYSKRDVMQKLQQQIKRRDDMIMEMQAQMTYLQNSLNVQMVHTTHLQAQLDSSYRELFDSKREIRRIRKAIADHCMCMNVSLEKPLPPRHQLSQAANWRAGEHHDDSDDVELICIGAEKARGEDDMIEMLRKSVKEIKEVIEGKDFLIENYKEQKRIELCSKMPELQLTGPSEQVSSVPNIL